MNPPSFSQPPSSNYYHVIRCAVAASEASRLEEWFYGKGSLGIEKTEPQGDQVDIKAYFDTRESLSELLQALMDRFADLKDLQGFTLGLSKGSGEPLKYEPFPLTGDFWVVPPEDLDFIKKNPTVIPLFLRLGSAFGSGRHETTQMVAEALVNLGDKPQTLLDLGTGSGILAILAKKWGVPFVEAAEISPEGRENAQVNFRLNGVEIALYENIDQANKSYDVILANILTPTVLYLKERMLHRLKPGGRLIVSGITQIEEPKVLEGFQGHSLIHTFHKGLWTCLVYEKFVDPTHILYR